MSMQPPTKTAKVANQMFVFILLPVISGVYYLYVFVVWGPQFESITV